MNEDKKKVLITSLGMAPGVVTTAVDVLQKEVGEIDKVVTLSTSAKGICRKDSNEKVIATPGGRVELLIHEFKRCYEGKIEYEPDCIKKSDLAVAKACKNFFELACNQIDQHNENNYDVYVSLAGGRKSMSGIMTLATQFFGAEMLFHIAITNRNQRDKIDDKGSNLSYVRSKRNDMLHPDSAELVELPFLNLRPLTKKAISSMEEGEATEYTQRLLDFLPEELVIKAVKALEEVAKTYKDVKREQRRLDKDPTRIG